MVTVAATWKSKVRIAIDVFYTFECMFISLEDGETSTVATSAAKTILAKVSEYFTAVKLVLQSQEIRAYSSDTISEHLH